MELRYEARAFFVDPINIRHDTFITYGSMNGVTPRQADHRCLTLWLVIAAVGTLAFSIAMGSVRVDRNITVEGQAPTNLNALCLYWFFYHVSWVTLSGVAVVLVRAYSKRSVESCPPRANKQRGWLSRVFLLSESPAEDGLSTGGFGHQTDLLATPSVTWTLILAVALASRLIVCFTEPPQLSDDLWRYVHDGRQLATGHNPYAHSPSELGSGQSNDPILEQINHPDLVTLYQPTSQYVFAVSWWLRPKTLDPLGIYTFRVIFVLIDLIVVVMLLYALGRARQSLWWAVMYAWHPWQ